MSCLFLFASFFFFFFVELNFPSNRGKCTTGIKVKKMTKHTYALTSIILLNEKKTNVKIANFSFRNTSSLVKVVSKITNEKHI